MKHLKLSQRIFLSFVLIVVSLVLTAGGAIWVLQRSLQQFTTGEVGAYQNLIQEVLVLESDLKSQVQEWKNVLLRGKDDAAKQKHWAAFEANEKAVVADLKKVQALLEQTSASSDVKNITHAFLSGHAQMGAVYRKALEAFNAAGGDPSAGDEAVKGIDREPIKQLGELVKHITEVRQQKVEEVSQAAQTAVKWAVGLSLLVVAAVLAGVVMVVRQLKTTLGGEPEQVRQIALAVADGHLGQRVPLAPGDTTSVMAAMDQMLQKLQRIVASVRVDAEQVARASAKIAAGNRDLADRNERQAGALEETASSMEELGTTVKQNADNARQANQLAQGASGVATEGGEVVAQVVQTMREINDSSKRISDIITVIDGIAFQTNILALNAAVEAARAGEQGRGFAVVAGEVRNLAQRSAGAAKEIKDLINASVERVEQGTQLVDKAGSTMTEIVTSIRRVTDIMGEISAANTEQSLGVSQVAQAVALMDQATQQNAALVEESASAAANLSAQAERLLHVVSRFKLDAEAALMHPGLPDASKGSASTGGTPAASRPALTAPRSSSTGTSTAGRTTPALARPVAAAPQSAPAAASAKKATPAKPAASAPAVTPPTPPKSTTVVTPAAGGRTKAVKVEASDDDEWETF